MDMMYLPDAYPSPYHGGPGAAHHGAGYGHHPHHPHHPAAADHYQAAAYAAKCAAAQEAAAYGHQYPGAPPPPHKMEYPGGRSACSYDQAVNLAAMGAHAFDYDSLGPLARMDPYGRTKSGRAKGRPPLPVLPFTEPIPSRPQHAG